MIDRFNVGIEMSVDVIKGSPAAYKRSINILQVLPSGNLDENSRHESFLQCAKADKSACNGPQTEPQTGNVISSDR